MARMPQRPVRLETVDLIGVRFDGSARPGGHARAPEALREAGLASARFGKGATAYARYRLWCKQGLWQRIIEALGPARGRVASDSAAA